MKNISNILPIGILIELTLAEFKKSIVAAKKFMDRQMNMNTILIINARNEWIEESYLEPDTVHKMQFLHAIKQVFCKSNKKVIVREKQEVRR